MCLWLPPALPELRESRRRAVRAAVLNTAVVGVSRAEGLVTKGFGPLCCSLVWAGGVWVEEAVERRVRRRRKGSVTPGETQWPAAGVSCRSSRGARILQALSSFPQNSGGRVVRCRVTINRTAHLELKMTLAFHMKLGTPGVCFLPVGHRTVSDFRWVGVIALTCFRITCWVPSQPPPARRQRFRSGIGA